MIFIYFVRCIFCRKPTESVGGKKTNREPRVAIETATRIFRLVLGFLSQLLKRPNSLWSRTNFVDQK